MTKLAVIYHSGFGHTEVQAQSVLDGANLVEGVTADLIKAEDVTSDLEPLKKYDAMIFGTPTYMGSVSAPFKAFMDASSKAWYKREWQNKVAAGFTNSHSLSGDKLNTLIQLNIFAMQHGMIWVGQSESNDSPEGEPGKAESVNRIGSYLGAMAQSEKSGPPAAGDLETARKLGERVATITKKLIS